MESRLSRRCEAFLIKTRMRSASVRGQCILREVTLDCREYVVSGALAARRRLSIGAVVAADEESESEIPQGVNVLPDDQISIFPYLITSGTSRIANGLSYAVIGQPAKPGEVNRRNL